jgi:hypothetical protein
MLCGAYTATLRQNIGGLRRERANSPSARHMNCAKQSNSPITAEWLPAMRSISMLRILCTGLARPYTPLITTAPADSEARVGCQLQ